MQTRMLFIVLGVMFLLAAPALSQNSGQNPLDVVSSRLGAHNSPTLATLQHFVEQQRWEEARNLMQQILASQQPVTNSLDLTPDNASTLLNRPHDEVYKMCEADVRGDMAARKISQQYKAELNPVKKKELLGQLEAVVTDQFQVRQKIRELELAKLEQRLAEVKAQLNRRQELADAIVERRVNQLTDQADELDWDYGMRKPPSVSGAAMPPLNSSYRRSTTFSSLYTPSVSVQPYNPGNATGFMTPARQGPAIVHPTNVPPVYRSPALTPQIPPILPTSAAPPLPPTPPRGGPPSNAPSRDG